MTRLLRAYMKLIVMTWLTLSFHEQIFASDIDPAGQETSEISSLELAYQREFVFLRGQKKLLEERLERQKQMQQGNLSKLDSEVAKLQNQTSSAEKLRDQLQRQVTDLDEQLNRFEEQRSQLENTLLQASSSLKIDQFPAESNLTQQLEFSLQSALSELQRRGEIREEAAPFFLADGRQTQGTITFIGQLAAYGQSADGGGGLAPAGEGRLQVWLDSDNQAIPSLEQQSQSLIKTYLFDSQRLETPVSEKKTLTDTLIAGGMIGAVILGLGLIVFLVILIKTMILRHAQNKHNQLVAQLNQALENHNDEVIPRLCEKIGGGTAKLVHLAVTNLHRPRDQFEDVISEGFIEQSHIIDRYSTFILVVSAVAPLLGLLGTVTGMISTFDIITEFGTGDPKMLSGGISEALVTTMFGLVVAIPALLLGNMLSSWGETLKSDMEKVLLKISNAFGQA